jgi:hypothetical protein
MAFSGGPLLRSRSGVKRTSVGAPQMSASDPKRTFSLSEFPRSANLENLTGNIATRLAFEFVVPFPVLRGHSDEPHWRSAAHAGGVNNFVGNKKVGRLLSVVYSTHQAKYHSYGIRLGSRVLRG